MVQARNNITRCRLLTLATPMPDLNTMISLVSKTKMKGVRLAGFGQLEPNLPADKDEEMILYFSAQTGLHSVPPFYLFLLLKSPSFAQQSHFEFGMASHVSNIFANTETITAANGPACEVSFEQATRRKDTLSRP